MSVLETPKRPWFLAPSPIASAAHHETAGEGQGNPEGARAAALTLLQPVVGASAIVRRFAMGTSLASFFIIALIVPSLALDLKTLRPGAYLPADIGCDGLGGGAQMSFDGTNFSGHYQLCRTEGLGGDRFRSTCIEAQGPNQPTLQDIDKDANRTTAEATIVVKSPTSFTYDGQAYRYCEAP